LGGLSKKAYQLNKIRSLHELPYLTLDAGNLLFKQESLSPALLDQAVIAAEAITASYNLMQYDAVAVGRNDLAAGLSFLEKQAARSNFKWLSANLVRKSTGKPVFPTSMIRQVGNIRVGIIGLTDNDANIRLRPDEDAALLPWQDILPDLAAELSSRCDMLILLSNNPTGENLEIVNSLADIHVVILSSPRPGNSAPQLANKSIVVQTGKQGKYQGWMLIDWQASRTWGRDGATKELATRKQELDGINGRINRIERKTAKNDLAANTSYQKLLVARDEVLSRIVFLENEQKVLQDSDRSPATFENNFITLDVTLPDQPDVQRIVETAKLKINEAGRSKATAAARTSEQPELSINALPFTGWETCAQCHEAQTDFWRKTDHFSTYNTLVENEQQFNLDCLPCHVTAEYGVTRINGNGSILLSLPPVLQQVGCEVCHGPGKIHAATQDPAAISRIPAAVICLRCHTPERDEEFNYDNDVERIACPASN
jgi:cytochrome c553